MKKSIFLSLIGLFMSTMAIAQPSYFKVSASNNTVVYEENGNLGTVYVLSQWSKQWIPMDSSDVQNFTDTTAANTQLSFLLNGADSGTVYYFKATIMDSATGMVLAVLPPTGRDSMITVCGTITVTASASPSTICNGSSATLTGSGASTYVWSTGQSASSIVVNPTSMTSYSVTGTNTNGCTGTNIVSVTVNPNSSFIQSPTICSGQSVTVGSNTYTTSGTYLDTLVAANGCDSVVTTNLTVNPNSSFVQSPTICAGQSVTVGANTYTTSGTFQDTLVAANGCDSVVTTNLTVKPNSSFSQSPIICNGQSVTVGANTYTTSGTFQDTLVAANGCDSVVTTNLTVNPNASFAQSPIICSGQSVTVGSNTYTVSGSYQDTLIAANGCDSVVTTNLTVNSLPVIVLSGVTTICNGSSTILTASGATTYLWMPGSLTGSSVTVSPTTNTNYVVAGIDANGCMGINTISVTVNGSPSIAIAGSTTICAGDSTILTASGGASYVWMPGSMTGTSVSVSPPTTTTYTATGTDANGCTNVATATVTINPTPIVNAGSDATVCLGNAATLTAGGANSYVWSNGQSTASIVVAPTNTTSYSVTGIGANGCTGTDSVSVTVNPLPVAAISGNNAVCSGNAATLTATGGGSYSWSPGNQSTSVISVISTTSTNYSVVVTDANGCTGASSFSVAVDGPLTLNGNLPIAYAGQPNYSGSFTVTGSSTPCTFAVTAPSLPYGMSLLLNGTFDPIGYATAAGFSMAQITATNQIGCNIAQWFPMQVDDPNPGTLLTLSSYSVFAGGPALTLTLTVSGGVDSASFGTNNNSPRATTYLSPTQVAMVLTAADVASPTQFPIKVKNPTYPNGTNSLLFTVVAGPVSTTPTVTISGVACGPSMPYPSDTALIFYYCASNTAITLTFRHDTVNSGPSNMPAPMSPITLAAGSGQRSQKVSGLAAWNVYYFAIQYQTASMTQPLYSNVDSCNTYVAVEEYGNSISQLKIFPNPLIGQIAKVTFGNKNGILTLYDITSNREVRMVKMKDGKADIEKAGLVSGFYMLQFVSDEQEIAYGKLIVIK